MIAKLLILLSCAIVLFAQAPVVITSLGTAFKDKVDDNGYKYFTLDTDVVSANITSQDQTLSFVLTSLAGDADLYISKTTNPVSPCDDCILKGSTPRSEVKSVKKTDPVWPGEHQKFYIGIHGYNGPAQFVFNVFLDRVNIENDTPQTGAVSTGKYTYFQFTTSKRGNFTISLTPLNGDPDLYVSKTTRTPTSMDFDWFSVKPGFDVIPIGINDPKYVEGTYYIGVRGFSDSYYTLSVSYDDTYTEVIEGIPMSSFARASTTTLFKYTLLKKQRLVINTIPLTERGDPDIYVTDDVSQKPPGRDNKKWDRTTAGDDSLTIDDADAKTYYIGIYAFARDTDFQLVVTTEQKSDELIDGQIQRIRNEQNNYKYFRFVHMDSVSAISFTVMPDPAMTSIQIYSALENTKPDANKHDKQGHSVTDNIYNRVINYPAPTKVGTYYLGVLGQGSYRIVAATNQSFTYLRDSQGVSGGDVPYGYYRYYIFNAGEAFATQDFAVAVQPTEGDVDLYVSTAHKKPSRTENMWSSAGWAQDTVFVTSNDPKTKGNTTFYIGVYGASQVARNRFSIVAFMSGTEQPLQDGVPLRGAVRKDHYVYYNYTLKAPGSISINLEMAVAGEDADIYVSTKPKPTKLDAEYKSLDYGNDFLTISDARQGTYYIGILGERSHGESISYTLSVQENYQTLSANSLYGNSLLSYTPKGKVAQFRTRIYSYADHVLISQTLINGRTKMYINFNATDAKPGQSQITLNTWPSTAYLISKDNHLFKTGQWGIGVEAEVNSEYFMSVSVYPYRAYLRESIPMIAAAPKNGYMIYSYFISDVTQESEKQDYYITPRVLDGEISLYVNIGLTEPTKTNHTAKWEGGILVLHKNQLQFGRFITIAIYGGNHDNNVFSILLSPTNGMRLLIDDQPQQHRTIANDYNRYEVLKPHGKEEYQLRMAIESCDTRPAPVGYISQTRRRPKKEQGEHDEVTFSVSDTQYWQVAHVKPHGQGPNATSFYIGVYSDNDNHLYSIYTTTRDEIHPIKRSGDYLNAFPIDNDKLRFQPPTAAMSSRPDQVLHYQLYLYTRDDEKFGDKDPRELANMYTVCGIKGYGKLSGFSTKTQGQSVDIDVSIDNSKTYLVNVIVSDGYGVETAYHPGYIIKGKFYPDLPYSRGGVSVGGILILVFALLLALYFIIGSAWNFFKNKARGKEIIPNYEFWADLPFLIWDGIKFIATCGRRSTSYAEFDRVSSPTEPYASQPSAATTTTDRSSYGAI